MHPQGGFQKLNFTIVISFVAEIAKVKLAVGKLCLLSIFKKKEIELLLFNKYIRLRPGSIIHVQCLYQISLPYLQSLPLTGHEW